MSRRVAISLTLACALAWSSPPRAAVANGRFPASTTITTRPGAPGDLFLGVTFGLLISRDSGASFHWLCENAVGYAGVFDPKYRVASDGTIYATNFDGLRVSRDGGCSFEFAAMAAAPGSPGAIFDKWVDAIDVAQGGEVWIGTADGGKPNDVYRSTDMAHTFSPMGLASSQVWYKSLVASRDGARLYASGYQVTTADPNCTDPDPQLCPPLPPRVRLYRTDNPTAAKVAWTELAVDNIPFATTPLFLFDAVHPSNSQIIYGRSIGANSGGDVLLRSTNAGVTWSPVLSLAEPMRAVAIRASGEVWVGTLSQGIFVAADGETFTPLADSPSAACLGVAGDGKMLACGANWEPNFFALATSENGDSWQTLARFSQIKGPLMCPTGTLAHDTCAQTLWPAIAEQFGIEPAPDALPDAPTPTPPSKPCCSGAGATSSLFAAVIVAISMARRRRRHRSN